jgi:hypothetical protein
LVGRAKGLQESVSFRDDVEAGFFILEIPGSAIGPGGIFVVPAPLDALEVIVSQPLDGERFLGCLIE